MKACVEEGALAEAISELLRICLVCLRNHFHFLRCSLCLEFEKEGMPRMHEAVILAMNTLMITTFPSPSW